MQFRPERRRRVMTDDSASAALTAPDHAQLRAAAEGAEGGGRKSHAYNLAARRDKQPRLIDFVPTLYRTFVLWWLSGVIVVAGLEGLYISRSHFTSLLAAEDCAALDLASHRSLASWCSSLLLGTCGAAALLLYSLRRHRVDDYHGRYRIWLWSALGWFLLSIDETTSLHRIAQGLLSMVSQRWGLTDGLLATTFCCLLLGVWSLRLLFETRHCRLAMTMLIGSLGTLAVTVAAHFSWLGIVVGSTAVMWEAGGRMVAQMLLLTSLGLYARHVILDAEGALPARTPKAKVKKTRSRTSVATSAESSKVAIDPPQTAKPHITGPSDLEPARSTTSAAPVRSPVFTERPKATIAPAVAMKSSPVPAPSMADDEDDDDQPEQRGLTRAERKKLRREMKQQQRKGE